MTDHQIAVIKQALEAMNCSAPTGKITLTAWYKAVSDLDTLLAQQADPVAHSGWVLREVLFDNGEPIGHREPQHSPAALAQEPVDVGLLEYRGNSVAFIYQKMTAYRTGIDAAWDAFRAKGLQPDGKTSLADMIAKHAAPPKTEPVAWANIGNDRISVDPATGIISIGVQQAEPVKTK